MSTPKLFARITKVDEAKRLVHTRVVEEVPDKADEIFDYASSKPYFEAWSKNQFDASQGKSYGNVRAMHGKSAAGILPEPLQLSDAEKAIDAVIKVTDDQDWAKCLDGTYTGVSIGGRYVGERKAEKMGERELKRYTADPVEISLVDSPCVPTALFFQVMKADGTTEERPFKVAPKEVAIKGTDGQVDELVALLDGSGLSLGEALELLRVEGMLETIAEMEKREFSAEERKKAAKEGHALPDGSFPINSVQDLKNAVRAYGRAKDKAKAKAHIIARAKALGATKELPEGWGKIDEGGELKKGMWNVSRFAECLECVASICASAQGDFDYEGDDSPVPQQLRNWLGEGIEIFKGMAEEEASEMLASLKSSAGVGEDDEIEQALEAAARAGELKKQLNDPALAVVDLVKIAERHLTEEERKPLKSLEEIRTAVLAKAGGMSQAHKDKLQAVHDHAADMGAECRSADKGQPADELAKTVADKDAVIAKLQADVEALKRQPMPHHIILKTGTRTKEQDNGTDGARPADAWLMNVPYEKLTKLPGGLVDWEASARNLQHLKPAA